MRDGDVYRYWPPTSVIAREAMQYAAEHPLQPDRGSMYSGESH